MKVAVIGTGYVGLVAGACFAHGGHRVICVDIDERKITALKAGSIPIYEPGLATVVAESVAGKRLGFSTDTADSVADADCVFIAVGTPPGEDGSADLTYVLGVASAIAPHLTGYTVVVCKSTVPVGTCDKVEAVLRQVTEADLDVVSNPEFLKEGAAIEDFFHPDRVVIGTDSDRAKARMAELYHPFVERPDQLLFMARRSAEMTKNAANCMLAARISFMNEMAGVCDKMHVDVDDVKRGIGTDRRIGRYFLNAGIGYGGSCFPKDVKALLHTGQSVGCDMALLEAVEVVNAAQKRVLAEKVLRHFGAESGEGVRGKTIAMLGLAFKPETDDMREAPSIVVAQMLVAAGADVVAYDPVARETAYAVLGGDIAYAATWRDAVANADVVTVVTEWLEFRGISPEELAAATPCRLVFDGRNIWDPQKMAAAGFTYAGIGRPPT